MSNKLISEMGLPKPISNVFTARNLLTAKDVLSVPELDLATLLDAGLDVVSSAVARISELACPPHHTFCLKLSLLATLPTCYGGLNGRVIYFDTESKFSSRRMIEIGENAFPHIFRLEGMAQKMAGRIVVLRPTSLSELTERENERSTSGSRQPTLRWPLPFLKSLAEFSRIPVVVTNQIRSQNSDEAFHYQFQGHSKNTIKNTERLDSYLTAALGIQWAHAVNIRLIFEVYSGQRFIKVAKSPISPPVAFPFVVDSSGISLVSDDGIEVMGQDISTIHCQGQSVFDM